MGAWDLLWMLSKQSLTGLVIGLAISDNYASFLAIEGASMQPTLNPGSRNLFGSLEGEFVLLEKFCLKKYKFSRGDVVIFSSGRCSICDVQSRINCIEINQTLVNGRSPYERNERFVKRLIALQGDWVSVPGTHDIVKIPQGHCWVEGDNEAPRLDSRLFGPIPLGLMMGRVTHIIWPPKRIGAIEKRYPKERVSF